MSATVVVPEYIKFGYFETTFLEFLIPISNETHGVQKYIQKLTKFSMNLVLWYISKIIKQFSYKLLIFFFFLVFKIEAIFL